MDEAILLAETWTVLRGNLDQSMTKLRYLATKESHDSLLAETLNDLVKLEIPRICVRVSPTLHVCRERETARFSLPKAEVSAHARRLSDHEQVHCRRVR